MAEDEKPAAGDSWAEAIDRIRESAKWLVAALAAIGAVMVAGMQLSSIGSVEDPGRLAIAIAAALGGLLAIAVVIWRTLDLLAPGVIGIRELAQPMEQQMFRAGAKYLDDHPELFEELPAGKANRFELPALYEEVADARVEAHKRLTDTPTAETLKDFNEADGRAKHVSAVIHGVLGVASFADMRNRLDVWKSDVFGLIIVTVLGLVTFAWAANPAEGDAVSVSLRAADLSGADLRGVDLSNADLTGADLTDALLRGADVSGTKLAGVTWSNTECPDGLNSDEAGETCAGHLE